MTIRISDDIFEASPRLTLGIVEGDVRVENCNNELWQLLQSRGNELAREYRGRDLGTIAEIESVRAAYRQLGKEPSRYRGSAEALLRRLTKGRGLYQVNNVVDVNNLISLETRHPVGAYDVASLVGNIEFRVGRAGEEYQGIGKETVNLEGLPVFADERGPFGSPTSDSTAAMIRPETTRVRLVIIAFSGEDGLQAHLERARTALEQYAFGTNLTTSRSNHVAERASR